MPDATTPNYGWDIPTVSADDDTWGTTLNTTLTDVDEQVFANAKAAASAIAAAPDSGEANAYVVTPTVPWTALTTGATIIFQAANASTGASTINISGLGVKPLTREDTSALQPADIVAGGIYIGVYDGTQVRLLNKTAIAATTALMGEVQLATAAQAQAGSSASLAVTPNALGSTQTIAASGSYCLPGGLILKWGTVSAPSGTSTVTFPVQFPNNCFNVQLTANTQNSGAQSHDAATGVSATGFTLDNQNSSTASFFWFAIGN